MEKDKDDLLKWLAEEFNKHRISKGLSELEKIVAGKTGKIEIVYDNPIELGKDKDKIIEIIKELNRKGIKLNYKIVGRRIKLLLLLSKKKLLKEEPLTALKIPIEPEQAEVRRNVTYAVENMRLRQEILKNGEQPIMKTVSPEEFYKYFEKKFLFPLSDIVEDRREYSKFSRRVLLQAYNMRSVDELSRLFNISIKELIERKDRREHELIFSSFKNQLREFVKDEKRYLSIVKLIEKYIQGPLMNWPITESFVQFIGNLLEDMSKLKDVELLSYVLRISDLIKKHEGDDDPAKGLLSDLG